MEEPPKNIGSTAGEITPRSIAEGLSAKGKDLPFFLKIICDFFDDQDTPLKLKVDAIFKLLKIYGLDDDPATKSDRALKTAQTLGKKVEEYLKVQNGSGYPQ